MALPSSPDGDKGRKLAPRGAEDAEVLGKVMAGKGYIPDVILCSPAVRTLETHDRLGADFQGIPVHMPEDLYNGSTERILYEIQALDDAHQSALVIAHNPGIHNLAARLAHEDSSPSLTGRLVQGYPAASLSVLNCPIMTWNDLQIYQNDLVDLMEPLDFNAPQTPARWT